MNFSNPFKTTPTETVASVMQGFTEVINRLTAVRDRELQSAANNRMVAEAAKNAALQNDAEAQSADKIIAKLNKLVEG